MVGACLLQSHWCTVRSGSVLLDMCAQVVALFLSLLSTCLLCVRLQWHPGTPCSPNATITRKLDTLLALHLRPQALATLWLHDQATGRQVCT